MSDILAESLSSSSSGRMMRDAFIRHEFTPQDSGFTRTVTFVGADVIDTVHMVLTLSVSHEMRLAYSDYVALVEG